MKVRALTSFVSETVSASTGDVFELPEEQAVAWARDGLIEVVRQVPVETAVAAPVEQAVTRRRK